MLAAGLVDDVESLNAALVRSKDALWAIRRDRLRSARAVDDLAAGDTVARRDRDLHVDPDRAERARPARGTRPRLGRALGARRRARSRPRRPDRRADRRRAPRPAVHRAARCTRRAERGQLAFVYKVAAEIGELGDNTAALRAADPRRRAPAARAAFARRARDGARSHALGERRHHLRAERASARQRRDREVDAARRSRAVRRRRAQRRHRQPRRPARARGAARRGRDHDRRQGDPGARLAPDRVGHRRRRRHSARRSRRSKARSRSRPRSPTRPSTVFLALRGSGQALYVGCADDVYVVASEPYGLVEVAPDYLRLDGETMREPANPASQGQIVVLDATAAGDPAAITRRSYDGTRAAGRPRRVGARRDHDARRRPRRRTALPPEGDHRGAGVVPQDAAGQARRSATACSTCGSRRRCSPTRCSPRLRERLDPPGRRHRSGHRGGRGAEPRDAAAPPASRDDAAHGRGGARDRVLRLRSPRRPARHARRRDQPERHHHRHEPHRRPRPGARRGGRRDREPPAERSRRQERRRALHVRRARRRDERGVDEGVLLADRGGLPARTADRGRGRAGRDRRARDAGSCSPGCASCPPRCARSSRAGRRSRPPRTATRRTAVRGRSSATASTASPRRSCGSSSRSSVTSRSPATRPRTRSTSTSRPSR